MGSLTPELLLHAYANGVFPMAESREDPALFWVDPQERGIIPLDRFHIPRSLRKTVRKKKFKVTTDRAFAEVMIGCATPSPERKETWINQEIFEAYCGLHKQGFAHSVECWLDDELAGGLYGVSLGGAFFGESMFSRRTDASKVALVHLVAHLKAGGYELLDTQFTTEHLERFGAIEIPRNEYQKLLGHAIECAAIFYSEVSDKELDKVLAQSTTQTS